MSMERQSTDERAAVLPGDPTIDYPFARPYGLRPAKGVLEPDGEKAEIVKRIFAKAASGLGVEHIAADLSSTADPAPEGSAGWNEEIVEHLLRDRTYIGEWNGIGSVVALVKPEEFDAAQSVLYEPAATAATVATAADTAYHAR